MKPITLVWEEVEPVAKKVFRIWTFGTEVQWARKAWSILTEKGLATYSNSTEKCLCVLRFIAMCDVYLDFVTIAFDEDHASDYSEWMREFECSPITLGVLLSRFGMDTDTDIEDEDFIIGCLAGSVRKETVQALVDGFGGISGFFQAAWLSTFGKETAQEEAGSALNEVTGEKLQAWSWVEQGCDPYRMS
jgi:hypothetical protein